MKNADVAQSMLDPCLHHVNTICATSIFSVNYMTEK